MTAHLGIGFVLTPRPSTPASHVTVTWMGAQSVDVVWNRITDEFLTQVRTAPTGDS